MPLPPDLLTVQQAASELSVTTATLHQQIGKGNLPAERIGKKLFVITRQDLETYKREHYRKKGWAKRKAGQHLVGQRMAEHAS